MSTTSYNLDNSALSFSWYWRYYWAANQIMRNAPQANSSCDFSFTGTGLQITCQTSGTAPTVNYSLDGGGMTALTGIPSGSWGLVNVGSQALADTLHTVTIQLPSATNIGNFWWQHNGGISVTGAAPAIALTSGFGPIYVISSSLCASGRVEGGYSNNAAIGSAWNANSYDSKLRFYGNPTGIKLWMNLSGQRIHVFQDGVDLGFVTCSGGSVWGWQDIRPNGVNFDGASHTYEVYLACSTTGQAYYQMMVSGGTIDQTKLPAWRKSLIWIGDSKLVNSQKLVFGGLKDTITCTNGSATVTGGAASGFTTLTSSGIALGNNQYISLSTTPAGPYYKLASSGAVIDDTHLKLASVFPDATQTSVPGYFSDLTTQADTSWAFPRMTGDALGFSSINWGVSGQYCLSKTVGTDGQENLQPASNSPHIMLDECGGVVVLIGNNDAQNDAKVITGATAASPVQITAASHGFSNGDTVQIYGVTGMTGVNVTTTISNVTTNTFTLDGTTGSGTYTAGSGIACKPTLDQFQDSVKRLLLKLVSTYGTTPIYVTGIPPTGSFTDQVRLNYNSAISAAVTSVGAPCTYYSADTWVTLGGMDQTDGNHFSVVGHSKITTQLTAIIPAATPVGASGASTITPYQMGF